MVTNEEKIGALILSGGKSRRMGRDKTTAEFHGETFLSRAVRFWKNVPGISVIYLSIGSEEHLNRVKKDPAMAELLEDERIVPVFDLYAGCGPMAGIHAAFQSGSEDWLYVCAIDMLQMRTDALPKLPKEQWDACVYREGDMTEPLFALYSRRTLPAAERLLSSGKYSLHALLDAVRTKYLPVDENLKNVFYNCNTPEDLKKLEKDPDGQQ